MSQSATSTGGEKPGLGGFFQVYLLAAVILMVYYTIDFQVSVSPSLPRLAGDSAAVRGRSEHKTPVKPTPREPLQSVADVQPASSPTPIKGDSHSPETTVASAAPAQIETPPAAATPPFDAVVPSPVPADVTPAASAVVPAPVEPVPAVTPDVDFDGGLIENTAGTQEISASATELSNSTGTSEVGQ